MKGKEGGEEGREWGGCDGRQPSLCAHVAWAAAGRTHCVGRRHARRGGGGGGGGSRLWRPFFLSLYSLFGGPLFLI